MIRIAFVSPYAELTDLALSMVDEWQKKDVALEVTQAIGSEAASRLRIKADVAICRGVTGVALRKVLAPEIPLVEVKTTGYDVMQAIHECLSNPANPRPYTVIGTRNMVHGLQYILDMLGLELECHLIRSESEGRACFEERMRLGPRTIIGGSTIVGVAKRRGVPAVLIRSGEESFRQALEEAESMARLALQERTAAEQTRIGMNALAEGIVMMNKEGIITECNIAAARLLQGPEGKQRDLVGREASRLIPNFRPAQVLSGREDFTLTHMDDSTTLAGSYFPVVLDGVNRGAVATLQEVSRLQELEGNIRSSLRPKGHMARYTFAQCLGNSPAFLQMLEKAYKYGLTQASILLFGETGTGKEMVAQGMHNAGPRRKGPFVAVNCAAFPENLLESLLFGYVGGAFTGAAREGRQGLFELAHRGTLFLDEVSEIPLFLQGRLLRVLQEQEVMRLGHDKVIPVDVRVISASNRRLSPLMHQGLFRGDLLYRLKVLTLTLPPLRERDDDIVLLARHFLDDFCRKNGRNPLDLSPEAHNLLRQYNWPGNVRELRNLCERIGVLSSSLCAGAEDVREAFDMGGQESSVYTAPEANGHESPAPEGLADCLMREAERQAIVAALTVCNGHKGLAARRLGISRSTLWRRLNA